MPNVSRSAAGMPAAAQAMEAEALFDWLVSEYKDRLYTYVRRLVQQRSEGEDLTQEVFIRAYRSLPAFRREAQYDTWLYRIATNLVIDRHRRRQRQPDALSFEDEAGEVANLPATRRAANPAGSLEARELQERVRRAVASLPIKLRLAVALHDLQGLSYEATSEALGCPVGTVKSRLFNARNLLKKKLRDYLET